MKPEIPDDREVWLAIRLALLQRPLLLDAVTKAVQEDVDRAEQQQRERDRQSKQVQLDREQRERDAYLNRIR